MFALFLDLVVDKVRSGPSGDIFCPRPGPWPQGSPSERTAKRRTWYWLMARSARRQYREEGEKESLLSTLRCSTMERLTRITFHLSRQAGKPGSNS